MKFSLLGDDPAALELVRAIAASPVDHLATATFLTTTEADVLRMAPGVRMTARWDELLADAALGGVIVAGAELETLEAAKQLAAAGKPLLVVPQAAQGSTFFYELSLVRDDTGVLLFPVLPARADEVVNAVRKAIEEDAIGRLQYLELSRDLAGNAPLLSTGEIDAAMLHDIDLLRLFGGNYNQVTALHFGAGDAGIATASVTLSGGGFPEAVWNVKRAPSKPHWELKLTGERGTAALTRDELGNFSSNVPNARSDDAEQRPMNRGAAILERFKSPHESPAPGDGPGPGREWTEIVRDLEIVEATHRSVRRRRTIDLHFESTSERSLFKTQMTAIGCGVLTFTLLAVVGLLVATPLLDVRDRQQVESERARAVLSDDAFEKDAAALTEQGRKQMNDFARRMPADRFNILIEPVEGNEALGDARRKLVVDELSQLGAPDAEQRTLVTEIRGQWLAGALRIVRIAVFLPLFLFLGLQLLLFLTRPPAN